MKYHIVFVIFIPGKELSDGGSYYGLSIPFKEQIKKKCHVYTVNALYNGLPTHRCVYGWGCLIAQVWLCEY